MKISAFFRGFCQRWNFLKKVRKEETTVKRVNGIRFAEAAVGEIIQKKIRTIFVKHIKNSLNIRLQDGNGWRQEYEK